jgi:flagellar protein FlbD
MIVLTKLNGPSFALNPDLIERVDADPDTVVVLIGGASYPIAESVDELLERVRDYRGKIIASAHAVEFPIDRHDSPQHGTPQRRTAERNLRVIPDPEPDK